MLPVAFIAAGGIIWLKGVIKSELHIPLAGEIVDLNTGDTVEPGTFISFLSSINTDDQMVLLAKEKTFLLKTNMYLLNNLLINNIKFAEKYMDSI